MVNMSTIIIHNDITYVKTDVIGKYRIFADFNEMNILKLSDIKQTQIDVCCTDCNKIQKTKFKSKFVYTSYLCHKCSISGNRNGFYGKLHSTKTKLLQRNAKLGKYDGEKNPMFGKSWKDIVQNKMNENEFKIFLNKRNMHFSLIFSGEKNPMFGKKHSIESRKKISIANKIYSSDPDVRKRLSLQVITALKKNRYKMTRPEKLMKFLLESANISCKYNFILNNKFQYDFIVINKKLLIEVHGDYWHCNPKFYPNGPINSRQEFKILRDIEKQKYANNNGYKIIYVWEDELNNNIELVKKRILHEI